MQTKTKHGQAKNAQQNLRAYYDDAHADDKTDALNHTPQASDFGFQFLNLPLQSELVVIHKCSCRVAFTAGTHIVVTLRPNRPKIKEQKLKASAAAGQPGKTVAWVCRWIR
jgi:hypothetical protein